MAVMLPRFTYNSINVDITTPLKEENDWKRKTFRKFEYSLNGNHQSAFEYQEETKNIKLTFLSASLRAEVFAMWDDWGNEGKTITYVPDRVNAPSTSYSIIIVTDTFETKRVAAGVDYWNIDFTIRKVIT